MDEGHSSFPSGIHEPALSPGNAEMAWPRALLVWLIGSAFGWLAVSSLIVPLFI